MSELIKILLSTFLFFGSGDSGPVVPVSPVPTPAPTFEVPTREPKPTQIAEPTETFQTCEGR